MLVFPGYNDDGNILPDICGLATNNRSFIYAIDEEELPPEEEPEDPEDPEPETEPDVEDNSPSEKEVINFEEDDSEEETGQEQESLDEQERGGDFIVLGPAGDGPNNLPPGLFDKMITLLSNAISLVPPAVALSIPYLILLLLIIISILLYRATEQEVENSKNLIEILKLEKILYEEKANFVMLSSHYLRTPMTLLNGGVESMIEGADASVAKTASKIKLIAKRLGKGIEGILLEVDQNRTLGDIVQPNLDQEIKKRYASAFVWSPIVAIGVLIILANILFVNFEKMNPNFLNFLTQALIFIIASLLFWNNIRKYFNSQKSNLKYTLAIDHERAIDEARNKFIRKVDVELSSHVEQIKLLIKGHKDVGVAITESIERFGYILGKLSVLSEIKNKGYRIGKDQVAIEPILINVLNGYKKEIQAKKISYSLNADGLKVVTDKEKLIFILQAVIDNAIKFNEESGQIKIKARQKGKRVTIEINDTGKGIGKEQLVHLFKPFSRAGSALDFDYQGIGLSLYLSRLIANYLGGDISINSSKRSGTKVLVEVLNWE